MRTDPAKKTRSFQVLCDFLEGPCGLAGSRKNRFVLSLVPLLGQVESVLGEPLCLADFLSSLEMAWSRPEKRLSGGAVLAGERGDFRLFLRIGEDQVLFRQEAPVTRNPVFHGGPTVAILPGILSLLCGPVQGCAVDEAERENALFGRHWVTPLLRALGAMPPHEAMTLLEVRVHVFPERRPLAAELIRACRTREDAACLVRLAVSLDETWDIPVQAAGEFAAGRTLFGAGALSLLLRHCRGWDEVLACCPEALRLLENARLRGSDVKDETLAGAAAHAGWIPDSPGLLAERGNRCGALVAHMAAEIVNPGFFAPGGLGQPEVRELRTEGEMSVMEILARQGALVADETAWNRPVPLGGGETRPFFEFMVHGLARLASSVDGVIPPAKPGAPKPPSREAMRRAFVDGAILLGTPPGGESRMKSVVQRMSRSLSVEAGQARDFLRMWDEMDLSGRIDACRAERGMVSREPAAEEPWL